MDGSLNYYCGTINVSVVNAEYAVTHLCIANEAPKVCVVFFAICASPHYLALKRY